MTDAQDEYPFDFPYEPYPLQVDLMRRLVEICEWPAQKSCHRADTTDTSSGAALGLLESPTGTGKSMSLVCALVHYLEKKKQTLPERTAQEAADASSLPPWVRDHENETRMAAWRQAKGVEVRTFRSRVERVQKHEEGGVEEEEMYRGIARKRAKYERANNALLSKNEQKLLTTKTTGDDIEDVGFSLDFKDERRCQQKNNVNKPASNLDDFDSSNRGAARKKK